MKRSAIRIRRRQLGHGIAIALIGAFSSARAQDFQQTTLSYIQSNHAFFENVRKIDTGSASTIMLDEQAILRSFSSRDSLVAMQYLETSDTFFRYFNNNLGSVEDTASQHKAIREYAEYVRWFARAKSNPGLEPCADCYFQRTVAVYVLKRISPSKLDTLTCIPVRFRKIISVAAPGPLHQLTSYLCEEYQQRISTGPRYEFIVNVDGRDHTFEKEIKRGNSKNDVQVLSLVIE